MRLAERWQRFWFSPESPTNLAACRILFYGFVFSLYYDETFAGWATLLKGAPFFQPVSLFKLLHLPIFSDAVLQWLAWAWKGSLILACAGLMTRVMSVAAFLLGAYLLALQNSDGRVEHQTAMLVIVLGIMALSRCGDALSMDAAMRRSSDPAPAPSGEYRWPVRTVWLLMSLVYFAAGIAKLRGTHAAHHTGFDWVTGDGFSMLMIQRFYDPGPPMVRWGLWIANHAWLAHLMAGTSLAVEVLFPLSLFDRRLRFIFPAMGFLMQVGIGLMMGVWFLQYLPMYVFWIPWGRLPLSRVHRRQDAARLQAV
ncbi:MAG TPA: hypothetical protein VH370_04995 [Humisphaera sp.]|nr:hypothetical protein [Humisphaera sp.]